MFPPCCVGHVLTSTQDLNSRAQAEVTIREALRELDLWGAAATFTLTEYSSSSGQTLTLIKDWKDIINQVDTYLTRQLNTSSKLDLLSSAMF